MIIYYSGNIPIVPVLINNDCFADGMLPGSLTGEINLMIPYAKGKNVKRWINKIIKVRKANDHLLRGDEVRIRQESDD